MKAKEKRRRARLVTSGFTWNEARLLCRKRGRPLDLSLKEKYGRRFVGPASYGRSVLGMLVKRPAL